MCRIKKCIIVAVMTLIVCVGCAKEETNKASAGVLMEPGGRFQVKFEENLDKSYYDGAELEKFIDDEVADFNEIYGEGSLKKASLNVENGKATLWYEFANGDAYVTYMTEYVKAENVEFEVYTYEDAVSAGLEFEGEFNKTGETGTISKDKFEETEKLMVVCTNQEMCVYIPEDIVYTSVDVVVDKDTASTKAEKINYILYKVEE